MTQAAVYKKIVALEREVQRMKIEAYRALPKMQRPASVYSEKALESAVRRTRTEIWRRFYAKKIKTVS
ncbi:hypothetical protein A3A38_03895 [Candidatus Kaiserbacteria bacterium RIFCSPLOWO2_01_FULL_53_17]|uniref:Uncharacterized protein n=1 Tax=Candidatus Kaiserbacteria bacterium RIFCSPLOWO2_01_FULL_53_17 TaxID=1798511 RepID=A0A1F6EHX5_9BACT|nr:MAG: hypothetical protein A3A38_03895 [Candidatus Kaiserbacteria bacterium RIFCSPLOWO2_01_FULL_53_17]